VCELVASNRILGGRCRNEDPILTEKGSQGEGNLQITSCRASHEGGKLIMMQNVDGKKDSRGIIPQALIEKEVYGAKLM